MKKSLFMVIVIIIVGVGAWYYITEVVLSNNDTEPQESEMDSINDENSSSNNLNQKSEIPVPSDWQTFESNNFNYTISYPSNWFFEEGNQFDDVITDFYLSPEQCGENDACVSRFVAILTVADKGCYTAEECADEMPYSAICGISTNRETTMLDQFNAIEQYEYIEEDCGTESAYQKVVYWIKDNTLYTLQGLDDSEEDYQEYANTFEQIKESITF